MTDMDLAMKNDVLLQLCIRWLYIKNMGRSVADYFRAHDINTIAIYGCGDLGKRLMEELASSHVKMIVGIDQCAGRVDAPIEVVCPIRNNADKWNSADAIVVTSPYFYNDIYHVLKTYGYQGKILALDDILMSI